MAWFSLYKWFIAFRIKPYTDWVRVYQRIRYDEALKNLIDVHLPVKGENLIFCHHAESDIVTKYKREMLK